MKCKFHNTGASLSLRSSLVALLFLVAFALFSRPSVGADGGLLPAGIGHEHGTNLAIYGEWRTNRLRLHYYVAPGKTYTLQYLALANTNNRGGNLIGAPWVNLPGTQAPRLPAGYDYEMSDFTVTNRHATNLGRIYRLKVT